MVLAQERLLPSDDLIREHSGGIDRETWLKMGDYTVQEMFVGVAKIEPDAQILDMGCGCGKISRALVDFLSPSGAYHGIDVGRECIDWCREAYRDLPNFQFHHADLFSSRYNPKGSEHADSYVFPIPSSSIDLAFLGSVFTHLLPDATTNYLKELARVLKPGGQVIATFFVLDSDSKTALSEGRAIPDFPFRLPGASGCRVGNLEVPEAAIAYDEDWLRLAYSGAGLDLFHLSRGHWGREPITPHWQDDLWARKPRYTSG